MKVHCAFDKMVSVSKLKSHPKNRNKHSKEQIERLSKILNYQGWRYPIKVSKRSGFITSGHGRLAAARKLKLKEVPVNFQAYKDDTQEYADVQSDNAIASWSELDLDGITLDLGDLAKDFDTDLLGLKDFKKEDEPARGCDEDEIPAKVKPKSKLGDLYLLGDHRLLCGDSTKIKDVERLMAGEKADMVFTDPPYGINLDTQYKSESIAKIGDGRVQRRRNYRKVQNDENAFDPSFILETFGYVKEMFLFGANYYLCGQKGSWVCWDKKVTEAGDRQVMGDFELAWSKNNHKNKMIRCTWFGPFGHNRKTDGDSRCHPTQKPVKMIESILSEWCVGLLKVADLFGGSGSTLIACEKTKRKCFMMEIDPHYCDVIVARWEKYTGKKALIQTIKTRKK